MAADLQFRIGAELSEIKGALAGLQRDFQAVGKAAQASGGATPFAGLQKGANGAVASLLRMASAFATVAGSIKLIGVADELNTLNARLKIATKSSEEFERAQSALFDLAQRTRTPLGETIKLYSQIANATKDAGVGQETLLGVVETINQAVQLSGASAQAAEAALMQLGQGLASGTLRGEELNSVLEQTPALADAIAKGMGITRGELRQYGQDGKISAEQVIGALRKQKNEIAKQFAELPLTVGQAVTMLGNSSLLLVGAFDSASGATAGIAGAIKSLADLLSSEAVSGAFVEFAASWSEGLAGIVDDFRAVGKQFENEFGFLRDVAAGFFGTLLNTIKEFPINIRAAIKIATVTFASMIDILVANAKLAKEAIAAIFTDDTVDAAIKRRDARVRASMEAMRATAGDAIEERQTSLDTAKRARETFIAKRRKASKPIPGSDGAGTFKAKASDADKKAAETLLKAQLDAEERLAKDSSDRKLGILQVYYEDARIAASAYFKQREEIELRALDRQIEIERQKAAAGGVDKVKALADIELLERQKGDVQRKAARDRFLAVRDVERELESARAQELEGRGQTGEAAKIRLEAQYRDLLKRLEAEGNQAGVRLIRGLIDTGAARARFDELKAEFDRVVSTLQQRTGAIADQQKTGALPTDTAQQQTREARAEAATQLDALNLKLQELAKNTNDPQIKQGAADASAAVRQMAIDSATGVDAAVISLRASLANMQAGFVQATTGAGVDALTNLFTDLASGTKTAGEALKDFARGFVASMAQIAARALATFLILQLMEAVFPGSGRTVAASGGVIGGVSHSGGMAGQGVSRRVDPLVFAGAPRYHAGGMVGLKPDERPAILQTGEEVLSRGDSRNAANGGRGGGSGYRIVNVLDPALVSSYLESAAGEKTILNVIQRNPAQVRQVIGG